MGLSLLAKHGLLRNGIASMLTNLGGLSIEINRQRPFCSPQMEVDPANSVGALGVFTAEGDT